MDTKRIKETMARRAISQSELARRIGVTQGTVNQILGGKTERSKYLPDIARVLDVSLEWMMGEDVPPGTVIKTREIDYVQLAELDIGYGMGGGSFLEGMPGEEPRIFDPTWLREITRSPPEMLFVARGIGDSMMPTLLDNDTLIVDRGQRMLTQQDRIWALSYGELGMVKRVRRQPNGTFLLMSDNPAISPIEASEDELHIVGRVVWIGRKT